MTNVSALQGINRIFSSLFRNLLLKAYLYNIRIQHIRSHIIEIPILIETCPSNLKLCAIYQEQMLEKQSCSIQFYIKLLHLI